MTIITLCTQYLRQHSRKGDKKYSFVVILKNLRRQIFKSELISEPDSRNSYEYCTFEKSFVEVLEKHALRKRKIFCGNYKPHVNKTLYSEFIKCSQLKIKAMKSKSRRCN